MKNNTIKLPLLVTGTSKGDYPYFSVNFLTEDGPIKIGVLEYHEFSNFRAGRMVTRKRYVMNYISNVEHIFPKVFGYKEKINKKVLEKIFDLDKIHNDLGYFQLLNNLMDFKTSVYLDLETLQEKFNEEVFPKIKQITGLTFEIDVNNSIFFNYSKLKRMENEELKKEIKDTLKNSKAITLKKPDFLKKISNNNLYFKETSFDENLFKNLILNGKYKQQFLKSEIKEIKNNLKINNKTGKSRITSKLIEESNFLKKLKELDVIKKKVLTQLNRSKINNTFITKNIENLYNLLMNNRDLLEINKDYLSFNKINNHMEFYSEINSRFMETMNKAKGEINESNILNKKLKEHLNQNLDDLFNKIKELNGAWNISVIKKILNNDIMLEKYPILDEIKNWLENSIKKYQNQSWNENISESLKEKQIENNLKF